MQVQTDSNTITPVLTAQGRRLLAEAVGTGENYHISHIGLGPGKSDVNDSEMKNEAQRVMVDGHSGSVDIDAGGQHIHVTAKVRPKKAYDLNEIGFYLNNITPADKSPDRTTAEEKPVLFALYSHDKDIPLLKTSPSSDLLFSFDLLMPADLKPLTITNQSLFNLPAATPSQSGIVRLAALEDAVDGRDSHMAITPQSQSGLYSYQRAQLSLSGGGRITWQWQDTHGLLRWSQRFTATGMGASEVVPDGVIDIEPPGDGQAIEIYLEEGIETRPVAADKGVELRDWEALYAAHVIGGDRHSVVYRIVDHRYKRQPLPANWLLIAIVNGDDKTVKLCNGTALASGNIFADGRHQIFGDIAVDKLAIMTKTSKQGAPGIVGIDMGNSVMTGAANDYRLAQLTLADTGRITWYWESGKSSGRLYWYQPFVAYGLGKTAAVPDGYISVPPPDTRKGGHLLKEREALYAVHKVAGKSNAVSLKTVSYNQQLDIPSNWLLIAVVNTDKTIWLSTGVVLHSGRHYIGGKVFEAKESETRQLEGDHPLSTFFRYKIDPGGMVELMGTIPPGSYGAFPTPYKPVRLGYLPEGYRPVAADSFLLQDGSGRLEIQVTPDGSISIKPIFSGGGGWREPYHFKALFFPAKLD
ncbi:hypothetical protein FKG94_17910 [Exilibacterium tricleocarpae]|uniref:Uncharacterized protein n=1 Tax=Exilibacterium tricleocarpae TaxID=2591008 RepID=A0A545T5X2_9GAMM|nr:hypothetical protein [Exilibacterium tricleocarpae]TQV72578.1 hypothetical protein FKG94_17910 [Exilibacterium tricleocarpae]